MPYSSLHALAHAIMVELERAGDSLQHGVVHISSTTSFMTNGIKQCSVQVECEAGCGWLVQAFGEEADELQQKAIAIQGHLHRGAEGTSNYALEIVSTFFPGIVTNTATTIRRTTNELIV